MTDALLQVKNLSKRFGGIVATDDLSLDQTYLLELLFVISI